MEKSKSLENIDRIILWLFFILLVLIISLYVVPLCRAEQRYNVIEDKWETVPDNSNWQTRYNSHTGKWSFQPPEARIDINPHTEKWEWDSGHGNEDD